jgi:hypothetical protein
MAERRCYTVTTWDTESQAFTPQSGIAKSTGLTLWEVRSVLRELQTMGYSCDRNDPSVLVELD